MASNVYQELFEDSDPDEVFEGFSREELEDTRPVINLNQPEDDDDLSVYEYSSEREESETSEDDEAPLANNNVEHGRNRAGGRNNDRSVENKEEIWTETFTRTNLPEYLEIPGPKVILDRTKTELDFFNLLLPLNLCAWIANETNRYATQCQAVKGPDQRWYETDSSEIRAFIGIRVYMSVIDLPDIKMYWSEDCLFGGLPIANVMSRSRFEKISQYFHIADRTGYNHNDPNRDKLHLVREILDCVNGKLLENYTPHKESSIDEAMIAFRGTLAFRQYMPAKPAKYGIKVWMRADSHNGYANEFEVYVGRPAGQKHEVGLGKKVILKLTEKLAGKNNHIYFDRFFNSVDLHQELLRRKLFGCGTVKRNVKNLPIQMANKKPKRGEPAVPKLKLNPGEFKQWQKMTGDGPIIATIWQENKKRNPVCLVSSNTDPTALATTVQRKQKDGSKKDVPSPWLLLCTTNT